MQVVIEIGENIYKGIQMTCLDGKSRSILEKIIANGVPLPKGHGNLIDADEALRAIGTWDKFGCFPDNTLVPLRNCKNVDDYVPYVHYDAMIISITNAPTIIEADKEGGNAGSD